MGWYVTLPRVPKGGTQLTSAQVAIDATQGYVKTPSSPGRILESYGEAARKIAFVFFVRNPTDRAWSHYFHKKKCCLGEKTFEQWVDEQLEACAACRLARPDAPLWPDCDPKTDDNANALVTGLYVQQLRHWLRYFAAEQFLIVPYAGFVAHPSEAVRAIVGKAGIEFKQTWEPSAMKRKNAKTPGDQTPTSRCARRSTTSSRRTTPSCARSSSATTSRSRPTSRSTASTCSRRGCEGGREDAHHPHARPRPPFLFTRRAEVVWGYMSLPDSEVARKSRYSALGAASSTGRTGRRSGGRRAGSPPRAARRRGAWRPTRRR